MTIAEPQTSDCSRLAPLRPLSVVEGSPGQAGPVGEGGLEWGGPSCPTTVAVVAI